MRTSRILRTTFLLIATLCLSVFIPSASSQDEKKKEEDPQQESSDQKPKKKVTSREEGPEEHTRRIVTQVLRELGNTIEGQSTSSLREVIDDKKFYDYPRFEDELERLFRSVGEMRFFTRRVSVQTTDGRAVAIVEVEMAFADRVDPTRRETRREQITFDFHRTPLGWKIIEIKPRSFFYLD